MDKKIANHFKKVDPILFKAYLDSGILGIPLLTNSKAYFKRLCREIINQQLSDKVGDILCSRFETLFKNGEVTPEKVIKISDEKLRSTGISYSKARYIKGLAKDIIDGNLVLDKIESQDELYIIEHLTKVKGIGNWTAEMFLIFCIGKENIFSHGDLGLKRAIVNLYKLQNPTKEVIEMIASKWTPYKSYACRILWKTLM